MAPTTRSDTRAKAVGVDLHKTKTKTVMKKKAKAFRKPSTFRLFDLPSELVDMVYAKCIQNGSINILQTSHGVYSQASRFLKSDGMFRIAAFKWFSYYDCRINTPEDSMTFKTITQIQNVELRLVPQVSELRRGGRPKPRYEMEDLLTFAGTRCHRNSCRIYLEVDISDLDNGSIWYLYDEFLKHCTGFSTVSFVYTGRRRRVVYGSRLHPLGGGKQRTLFKVIRRELEPRLGPGVSIDGKSDVGKGLEFHPLNHLASLAAAGSSSL